MSIYSTLKRGIKPVQKLLPILSFAIPVLLLYSVNPFSFETTWKGRAYYIIFIWLAAMEVILNWGLASRVGRLKSARAIVLFAALLLPTIYVVLANSYGLNNMIADVAKNSNVYFPDEVPLSTEYLVFTALFGLIITAMYGLRGLKDFSIPALLIGIMGTLYMIDNFYPYGRFTPLQIFVPTTSTLAGGFLNLLGYQTRFIGVFEGTTVLLAWNSVGSATFGIAWPCAGVEGLIIYAVLILMFIQKSAITLRMRLLYFVIGAGVTYFINIMRIVAIFTIAANQGDWLRFHNYYGQMLTVTWIVSYMLIITAVQTMWKRKTADVQQVSNLDKL